MNLPKPPLNEARPGARKAVAVLFGGCSPEYHVSLQSAAAVLEHLDRTRYEPVMVGIAKTGEWYHYTGPLEKIAADAWRNPQDCAGAVLPAGQQARRLLVLGKDGIHSIPLDAAFPVLHGRNGEDGTVQGVLALAGLPVAGCGVLASALCMDKAKAHALAHAAGVRVPAGTVLDRDTPPDTALAQADALGYPLFVKPVKAGSSFGITRAQRQEEVPEAIRQAFQYDDEVILEEAVSGFEVGCAVLGGSEAVTGEVDEIALSGGFFNFREKYTLETSAIHVPARIPAAKAEEVKRTAKAVYRALGCRGFARVDFFLDTEGRIIFNEVNTIPGFTAHSRYPSMMQAAGWSFPQVLSAILDEALQP